MTERGPQEELKEKLDLLKKKLERLLKNKHWKYILQQLWFETNITKPFTSETIFK